MFFFFFFQAEDGIRDVAVTGVQTCALPISEGSRAKPGNGIMKTNPRTGLVAVWLVIPLCASAAEEARQLRLGHFPNITHAQAVYARAGGQFERKIGVPIKWSSFNAGPTAIEALLTDGIGATFVAP